MAKHGKPTEKRRVLRALVILFIVIAAGPEIGIALELIGMIDLVGVELFLGLVFGGVLWRVRVVLTGINRFFERLDPFYFIPSRQQVVSYPGILVHAVPFLVSGCIAAYLVSDTSFPDGVI
jgi:hypothetical protein